MFLFHFEWDWICEFSKWKKNNNNNWSATKTYTCNHIPRKKNESLFDCIDRKSWLSFTNPVLWWYGQRCWGCTESRKTKIVQKTEIIFCTNIFLLADDSQNQQYRETNYYHFRRASSLAPFIIITKTTFTLSFELYQLTLVDYSLSKF